MSTFYIPNENGWNDNGTMGSAAKLRLKVDRTYNASTNRSSLTITMQGYAPSYSGKYSLLDNASITLNGSSLFSGGGSGGGSLSYYIQYQADTNWHNLLKSDGTTYSWTATVTHAADGTATAQFGVTARLYTTSYYFTFYNVSGSQSINETRQFTLSISAGTGSSITVKRGSTTLSNGATITYGDELTISFAASTGYNLSAHTVNGATFTSGNKHTVTGAVAVASTATKKTYSLSISAGTGSTIVVKRGTTTLTNGATITHGDVLTISFGVSSSKYVLSAHTVNGTTFTSGNTYTVSSSVSVIASASIRSYTLSLTANNSTVTVNRTSSPEQGAAQGYLQNGAKIYYGDVLNITYAANTGYGVSTATINNTAFNSGTNHTVSSDVFVVISAVVLSFTITEQIGAGASLTVYRSSSPNGGGTTGVLTDNTVYYGDVLVLTATFDSGYGAESMSVNDVEYLDNPHSLTVVENITIVIIAKALGFVYIDTGSTIEKYKILIDNGSAYEQYRAMIDTGSEIVPY